MLICEKNNYGPLCNDCRHGVKHEPTPTCIGDRCYTYAIAFAKKNIMCDKCEMNETCYVPARGDNILLFQRGEHCPEYRKRMMFAKCIEID